MNPGTFYLYEYENNTRARNAGFIKIVRHCQSCVLQINARGIPLPNGTEAELYAFFRTDGSGGLAGAEIGRLPVFRRGISVRLPVSEARFPEGRTLSAIDGFLILLPSAGRQRFWMASSLFFAVDIGSLRTEPDPELAAAEAGTAAAAPDIAAQEAPGADLDARESPGPDFGTQEDAAPDFPAPDGNGPASDPRNDAAPDTSAPDGDGPVSHPRDDAAPDTSAPGSGRTDTPAGRRIARDGISCLPRKFWPLANNSFLLHGYRNYGHLLLIEEDGRTWLGVPGVYDSREARAADLFGFPRFTRAYISAAGTEEDEDMPGADFGHWCRCVGPCPG